MSAPPAHTRGRRLRVAGLAAAACAVVVVGCFTTREVERRDWGAIPEDETVRVTTADGARRAVGRVTVYRDALVGVDAGGAADGALDSVRIPLDEIELIQIRRFSVARTALSAVLLGGAIGVVVALGESDVRPEPVESSCPFVYSFDGTGWVLDSETFAGAVARGLQRSDLDNLEHAVAVGGEYRFLLTNERPETQYTDGLTLVVADHASGSVLLPSAGGALYAGREFRPASAAAARHGGDATAELGAEDGRSWEGAPVATVDASRDGELRDGVDLTFPRPATDRALLAITARNTMLAPFALRTYLELHGDSLTQWYHRVGRDEELRARLTDWVAREGTLHVSVFVDDQWVLQDVLPDVGPYLAKTQVARLDLSDADSDPVRVRLEWARGLWTLDRVALGSVATDGVVALHEVPLRAAPGPDAAAGTWAGRADEAAARLAGEDGDYYAALPGDTLRLVAAAPAGPAPGLERSVLLRSSGYYLLHTRHAGAPATEIAERILDEPLFGNRYILDRLRREGGVGAREAIPR